MKVVIVDLGSRLNKVGGQARIAAILYKGLKKFFDTYYVGYETEYLKHDKNTIMFERGRVLSLSLRKSRLSEIGLLRFGYNLLIVRNMLSVGIDKEKLLQKMRSINPDVIIANSVQDIVLIKYLKRKGLEFKTVYIDHNSISTSIKSGYFSKEAMPLTIGSGLTAYNVEDAKKKFFNFFDANVALNHMQFNSIGGLTGKVTLILNGVDFKIAKNMSVLNRLRSRYGLEGNSFVILYLGRLFERQKNVSTLIRAFKKLSNENFRLLIAGEGPSLRDYVELAKEDKRIAFTGGLEDAYIPYMYKLADLFVLVSFWEGFSLTVLEAAANSLPIILSKNAYSVDLKGKDIGRILSVDAQDTQDLVDTILLIYKSRKARDYAVRVSKNIAKMFNENEMISKYRNLILKIVS